MGLGYLTRRQLVGSVSQVGKFMSVQNAFPIPERRVGSKSHHTWVGLVSRGVLVDSGRVKKLYNSWMSSRVKIWLSVGRVSRIGLENVGRWRIPLQFPHAELSWNLTRRQFVGSVGRVGKFRKGQKFLYNSYRLSRVGIWPRKWVRLVVSCQKRQIWYRLKTVESRFANPTRPNWPDQPEIGS